MCSVSMSTTAPQKLDRVSIGGRARNVYGMVQKVLERAIAVDSRPKGRVIGRSCLTLMPTLLCQRSSSKLCACGRGIGGCSSTASAPHPHVDLRHASQSKEKIAGLPAWIG